MNTSNTVADQNSSFTETVESVETGISLRYPGLYALVSRVEVAQLWDYCVSTVRVVKGGGPKWAKKICKTLLRDKDRPADIYFSVVKWGPPEGHRGYDATKVGVLVGPHHQSKDNHKMFFERNESLWHKHGVHWDLHSGKVSGEDPDVDWYGRYTYDSEYSEYSYEPSDDDFSFEQSG
jgi:hypothetical protein